MAINDLIARGSTPAPGQTTKRITDTLNRVADYRGKMLEMEEFQKDRKRRDAKRKLETTQAQQQQELLTEYGGTIKKHKVDKLETEIDKMRRQNKQGELLEVASAFYGVDSEEQFQKVVQNVPKKTLNRFGVDPKKGYEANRETLEYVGDRALHDVDQLQRLELAGYKARGDTSGMTQLGKLQRERDIAMMEGREEDVRQINQRINKEVSEADTAWRNVLGPATDYLMRGEKIPENLQNAIKLAMLTKEGPFEVQLIQALNTLDEVLELSGANKGGNRGGDDEVIDLTPEGYE